MIRFLAVFFCAISMVGCASGPNSQARNAFLDYGGTIPSHGTQYDYEAGYFRDWETTKKPNGSWVRNGKSIGRTIGDGHLIFGHFKRADTDTVDDLESAIRENEAYLLKHATIAAEREGFRVIKQTRGGSLFTSIVTGTSTSVALYVVKEEVGCLEGSGDNQCAVIVTGSPSRPGASRVGYGGMSHGWSGSDSRVMDTQHQNSIRFIQQGNTNYDEREFYKTLSQSMGKTMYVYLNANEDVYVQVDAENVVAYPFLINNGNILKFEKPVE